MNYKITGKNIEITDGLKDAIYSKLGKLEKFFNDDAEVHVTLSVQKNRQKIEVTIPLKGTVIRAEESSTDMYVSIDLVEEIIERQIKKYKDKLIKNKRNSFKPTFVEEESEADSEVKIIKMKKFNVKPMDPEEACVQMELLGHEFFVFINSNTDNLSVVYKRKDGTFGLIEPEM